MVILYAVGYFSLLSFSGHINQIFMKLKMFSFSILVLDKSFFLCLILMLWTGE